MLTTLDIAFGTEILVLDSDRLLWWPRTKTLFATDLHAGKTEHMRRSGLAIPGGSLHYDLQQLELALQRYPVEQLIFLGDLFHSEINDEWEVFAEWCRQQTVTIELVRGNHDRFLSDEQLQAAEIIVNSEPYVIDPFIFRHHPVQRPSSNELIIAGHVHPVYRVLGVGKDRLRLPCFWQQPQQLILPAFGSFTGGFAIQPQPNDKVYVCAADTNGSSLIKAR